MPEYTKPELYRTQRKLIKVSEDTQQLANMAVKRLNMKTQSDAIEIALRLTMHALQEPKESKIYKMLQQMILLQIDIINKDRERREAMLNK